MARITVTIDEIRNKKITETVEHGKATVIKEETLNKPEVKK